MTGYTVHTGTSEKFASGWDRVFSGKPKAKAAGKASSKRASQTAKRRKKS